MLIHGHLCNRGVWNDWQPGLRALGVPVIAPSLEPLFVSIDQHAPVIDAAIRRIETGDYGYCEMTGDQISLKRLDARPIATMTLEAQERHERRERVHRDD